jgi:hypothetical protein
MTMAIEIDELHLVIEGEEPATVGWITEALISLDYAYNLGAIVVSANQGYMYSAEFPQVLNILRGAGEAGLYTTNYALSAVLELDPSTKLLLQHIQSGNSVSVGLKGLGDVIKQLRMTFDRQERRRRKAQCAREEILGEITIQVERAKLEKEQLKVETARIEVVVDRGKGMTELIKDASTMRDNLQGYMPEHEINELIGLFIREGARAIAAVDKNQIRVIE